MSKPQSSLRSTIAVSLTNYLDAGSIVAGASGLGFWVEYLHLSHFAVGLLGAVSANAFGSAIGALVGGRLADRYGRKQIYTYNMLVYMLGVAIIALSLNFPMLLCGFLVTGLSVGVGVPASWTYISETSETANRARNIGISQCAWSIGPFVIFLLGSLLSPLGLLGNRLIFGSLFVVAFVAWLLQRRLDESKAWEESRKQEQAQPKPPRSPYRELFTSRINLRALGMLVGMYLPWNLVAGAMGFFMPYVYETVGGLTNQEANGLQMILWACTVLATYFGFIKFADRVSHRWMFFTGSLLGTVAWVVLSYVGMSWAGLWIFVTLWGVQAGIGAQSFYALWASELFPARYRAAAQGMMFFMVRTACGLWSMVFPLLLIHLGFITAGTIMVGLHLLSLLVGTLWTPQTRGKSLNQITRERYGDTK